MIPFAHSGGPELLAVLVPLVFIVVYRLTRGPRPPDMGSPVPKRPPR